MKLARTATKFIFCLIIALFVIGIIPSNSLTALAADDDLVQPIYTILTDNDGNKYAEITGYKFFSEDEDICSISIPEEIEGYPVKSIGERAFSKYYLEKVYMPDSIVSIGDYAFAELEDLEKVVLSKNLKTIGNYAFYGCTAMKSMSPITDGIESFGDYAFYGCSGFSELCIGNNVTRIGEGTFGYTSISKLTIGDNVTYIGPDAFSGCDISTLNLGRKIKTITSTSFFDCEKLTSVTVDKNNQYYKSKDGVLYTKDMSTLILYPCNKSGTQFNIPNSVTKINDYAFISNLNLKNIDIPNSVRYIGDQAFSYCQKLTAITIPSSVISLGQYTFAGTISINSIYIQNGLKTIDEGVFFYCQGLKSLYIPQSITKINEYAFLYTGNFRIYGVKGSYAEKFANTYEIPFLEYKLSTPNITKTQATGARNIKLTWSRTTGADGYMVYRSTTKTGGWSKIGTITGEYNLTYTDRNAVPGTQYYYTVKAYLNIGGKALYSGYNKTGFSGKTSFSLFKISRIFSNGYNRINLYWNRQNGVDGYYIYRSTKPTSGWIRIKECPSGTEDQYTDKDVDYNTQYYYTIRAYVKINNTIYKSDYVKTGVPGKSVAITPKVSIKSTDYNSATIKWNAGYDGDGYIVYRTTNSNNTGWEVIKTIETTSRTGSYTDKNLKCGTTYYYTVRSYKIIDGKKMKSGYEKYGKSCTPIPSTPKVKATQQKDKTVVISWNKIAGATTYKVYRRVPGGSWSTIKKITDMSILSYTDTLPDTKIKYEYTVKAYHNNIAGEYKAVAMTMYIE
ncbi:MAG: leucine-rich repeat protein [Acutalibacteraceae bacterium]